MPSPEHERREHIRLKLKVPIEIYLEGSDSPLRSATSDLSFGGVLPRDDLSSSDRHECGVEAPARGHPTGARYLVTCDPQVGNGIRFSRMLPEDLEQLRVFLEAAEKRE